MDKIASLAADIAKLLIVRGGRGLAGAGVGAGVTYGLNRATGVDEWANPLSQQAQYSTMAGLGALAAQPGAGRATWKYLFPRKSVGGTGLISDLLRPSAKRAPVIGRDFSPMRALSMVAVPTAAYKVPLLAGAGEPMSKLLSVDLPNGYAQELARSGRDPNEYGIDSYVMDRIGKSIVEKGEPVLRDVGEKTVDRLKPFLERQSQALTDAAKSTATELGEKAWGDMKPVAMQALKDTAAPLAGSLAGSGLGWLLGSAVYRDDKTLSAEERMARAEKQNMAKIMFSVLGGTVGTVAPSAPALWQYIKDK